MLSVVAIAKNEIKNVASFMASWSAVADEIVIVDTGSTDGTLEFLNGYATTYSKLRVGRFDWTGSFSDARNHAASLATGDWILWADLDDRVHIPSIPRIRELASGAPAVYVFQVASDLGDGVWHRFLQPRLYPARSAVKFEGAVHEKIEASAKRAGYEFRVDEEVIIAHLGYADLNLRKQKAVRNLAILLDQDYHDNPELLSQIGDAYFVLGREFSGLGYYEQAIRKGGAKFRALLLEKLCHGYLVQGATQKAKDAIHRLKVGTMARHYWQGELNLTCSNKIHALEQFKKALTGKRSLFPREDNGDAIRKNAEARIAQLEGSACVLA